ncbi:MAG TPA: putative sulfate exporter family transporter [Gammaproteobacteria bacterium]|nr:putative sulfate exporter family transporter [Gammaproteobacteria bacterium]
MKHSIRSFAALGAYAAGILFCFSPWASPGLALGLGLVFALALDNPYRDRGGRYVRGLLQASVVLLGFGVDIGLLLRAGLHGLAFAAVSIAATFALGYALARYLAVERKASLLISAGTAICGGSAIAAVGSAVGAERGEISVAMGTVFLLNAVALFLFPLLGHLLGLSQEQFGTWAGIAIHDVSSVAGAGAAYGADALRTATVVKLSRVLWIVPVTLIAARFFPAPTASRGRLPLPWFIVGFLLASLAAELVPAIAAWTPLLVRAARIGFAVTLFCIGASLSRGALKAVGYKPLLQGVLLWVFVSTAALWAVLELGASA